MLLSLFVVLLASFVAAYAVDGIVGDGVFVCHSNCWCGARHRLAPSSAIFSCALVLSVLVFASVDVIVVFYWC